MLLWEGIEVGDMFNLQVTSVSDRMNYVISAFIQLLEQVNKDRDQGIDFL